MNGTPTVGSLLSTVQAASMAVQSGLDALTKLESAALQSKAYNDLLAVGTALTDIFSPDPATAQAAEHRINTSLATAAAAQGELFSSSGSFIQVPAGVLKTLIQAYLKRGWEKLGAKF